MTATNLKRYTVSPEEQGSFLDAFLREKLPQEGSKKHLRRLIQQGYCLLNGVQQTFPSVVLLSGDQVVLQQVAPKDLSPLPAKFFPERILFEDDFLLLYDKPWGLLGDENGILPLLRTYYPDLHPVHRLDRETSGVMLFAKGVKAQAALEKLFRDRSISKEYYAVVQGVVKKANGVIENFLGRDPHHKEGTKQALVASKRGKKAITNWTRECCGDSWTFVSCRPVTGRTHQIRVHLASIGHPLLGDRLYASTTAEMPRAVRHLLHAHSLSFAHPFKGEKVLVKAPTPEELNAYLKK